MEAGGDGFPEDGTNNPAAAPRPIRRRIVRRVRRLPVVGPAPAAAIAPPVPDRASSLPYETFYGLTEKPFSLSTDPVFLYHSTAHDRTAQALLTSIGTRPGVVVITGPYGIGKTSLSRAVIEQLDRRTLTSFLVDPFLTVDDLLQTLLIDFGALSRDDLAGGRQPSAPRIPQSVPLRVPSLPVSALPRTRPADDNRPASSDI
jgi:hypothetical protein